jgi:hypothetical protein
MPQDDQTPTITENIDKFKATKNIYYLFKAIFMVLRRGRTHELLYGIYCKLVHKPSAVLTTSEEDSVFINDMLAYFKDNMRALKREFISVEQLTELYGERYAVHTLVNDFAGTRSESIIEVDNYLIVGEYGMGDNSARIAMINTKTSFINDHYMHVSGVRHIHALHRYNDTGELLVATGDRLKMLDLWSFKSPHNLEPTLAFKKRIKRFLAGYTAITQLNGDFYFGTDFSARPNYIETDKGQKFFFPQPAYTLFVMNFSLYKERYILILNSDLEELGSSKALSLFDTKTKQFVYSEKVSLKQPPVSS